MNELIKVSYEKEVLAVSGRELHGFLEVGTEYMKWFERMSEYGFSEGTDFSSFLTESTGGRPSTDHAVTIDMAKELCMIQRTDKGKQARQYFLQVEKAWNSPDMVMKRALQIADRRIGLLEADNTRLIGENNTLLIENSTQKQIIGELKPVKDYVDMILSSPGTMATTQIAADYGISAKRLNKILKEERIQRKVGGQWILYIEHMGKGLTKSKTFHFKHTDGRSDTKLNTEWTQRGRLMINDLLNRRGRYANADMLANEREAA